MNDKIKVVNNTTGTVGYNIENLHARRIFKPKQTLPISREEIEEGLYDQGIRRLFESGFLSIENFEDRVAVGLAIVDEEQTVVEDIHTITHMDITKALKSDKYADLFLLMKDAPSGTLDLIVEEALALGITDSDKVKLIKDKTGSDIAAILQKRKAIEE